MSGLRFVPLAVPKSAKTMASKMVVFPAPVSPTTRYRPLWKSSKGTLVSFAKEPNAFIVKDTGLMLSFPPLPETSAPVLTASDRHICCQHLSRCCAAVPL